MFEWSPCVTIQTIWPFTTIWHGTHAIEIFPISVQVTLRNQELDEKSDQFLTARCIVLCLTVREQPTDVRGTITTGSGTIVSGPSTDASCTKPAIVQATAKRICRLYLGYGAHLQDFFPYTAS